MKSFTNYTNITFHPNELCIKKRCFMFIPQLVLKKLSPFSFKFCAALGSFLLMWIVNKHRSLLQNSSWYPFSCSKYLQDIFGYFCHWIGKLFHGIISVLWNEEMMSLGTSINLGKWKFRQNFKCRNKQNFSYYNHSCFCQVFLLAVCFVFERLEIIFLLLPFP